MSDTKYKNVQVLPPRPSIYAKFFGNSAKYSGGGAVMEAITKEQLQSIEVIKPPLELQNEFSKRVQAIEAQKAQAQASLTQAEDLFNSLLQRAFKGELTG